MDRPDSSQAQRSAVLAAPMRPWIGALFAILPWALLPIIFAPGSILQADALNRPGMTARIFVHYLLMFLPWILFCRPVIQRAAVSTQRWPVAKSELLKHVALWLAIYIVHVVILVLGDVLGLHLYGQPDASWFSRLPRVVLHIGPFDAVIYCAVAGLAASWALIRRIHEREQSLVEVQLSALRAQLQPHFLFNVLNAVSELIYRNPSAADETLVSLSRLLRKFADQLEHTHSLRQEIENVNDYIAIQRMLLSGKIAFALSLDRDVLSMPVPSMLLQPLVENAVVHGAKPCSISITATFVQGRIEIVVANAAQASPTSWVEGVGIRNIRRRLAALYGDAAQLQISPGTGPQNMTEVKVVIPVAARVQHES